jgi:hypothetical protein
MIGGVPRTLAPVEVRSSFLTIGVMQKIRSLNAPYVRLRASRSRDHSDRHAKWDD